MAVRKILFFFDDALTGLCHLKATLECANYILVTANNGEEVVQKAKSEQPDLIYMDIMSHGIDIYKAMLALRNDPQTNEIPIVFFSNMHLNSEYIWAQLLDARNLVAKHE